MQTSPYVHTDARVWLTLTFVPSRSSFESNSFENNTWRQSSLINSHLAMHPRSVWLYAALALCVGAAAEGEPWPVVGVKSQTASTAGALQQKSISLAEAAVEGDQANQLTVTEVRHCS